MQRRHPPTLHDEVLEEGGDPAATIAPATIGARLRAAIGGGVLAAVAASLPAEVRMSEGASIFGALEHWFALSALLLPLGIVMVAVLRRGRVGLQILAGERASLYAAAALWWAVLELGVLSVFGAVLRAKTHHHGLAGVTFAILALISGLVVALLTVRAARMLLRMPRASQRVALGVVAATSLLVTLLIGVRTTQAEGMHTTAAMIDILLLVVASTIASTRAMARWRPLAVGGVPLAALIVVLGYAVIRAEPEVEGLLAQTAPVHAWVLSLF